MKRKKGFTLIELLVVIAIIAILLSVLMPALKKAKQIAKNITCRANLRSLSTGFRLYTDSNNSKLFPKSDGIGNERLWMLEMSNQLGKLDKIRYCPETKLNPNNPAFNVWAPAQLMGAADKTWIWPFDVPELERGSYGINGWLYINNGNNPNYWPNTNPPNSSSVPVFVDAMWVDSWPTDGGGSAVTNKLDNGFNLDTGSNDGSMGRFLTNRHREATNVSFVDGHVESVKLENMWSLKWGKEFDTTAVVTRQNGDPVYQR